MGEVRMYIAQGRQQIPGAGFADAEVAIFRLLLLLIPGDADAQAETGGD